MFLFGVRKIICTTPFPDGQLLLSWSTLKANVCIFLYISLRKYLFQRLSKISCGGIGGYIFFANMAVLAYHVISTEAEKHIFKHNWIFRHSCIYKQPTLTKLWNFHIFCKYYIVILDTLVSSFLDILFLLLAVILSELHEKPRRKDWVTGQSA